MDLSADRAILLEGVPASQYYIGWNALFFLVVLGDSWSV